MADLTGQTVSPLIQQALNQIIVGNGLEQGLLHPTEPEKRYDHDQDRNQQQKTQLSMAAGGNVSKLKGTHQPQENRVDQVEAVGCVANGNQNKRRFERKP